MKIVINPYDATKQIEFEDVLSWWEDERNNRLEITLEDGDVIKYNTKGVEFYRITR